jgi:hypothetical protein
LIGDRFSIHFRASTAGAAIDSSTFINIIAGSVHPSAFIAGRAGTGVLARDCLAYGLRAGAASAAIDIGAFINIAARCIDAPTFVAVGASAGVLAGCGFAFGLRAGAASATIGSSAFINIAAGCIHTPTGIATGAGARVLVRCGFAIGLGAGAASAAIDIGAFINITAGLIDPNLIAYSTKTYTRARIAVALITIIAFLSQLENAIPTYAFGGALAAARITYIILLAIRIAFTGKSVKVIVAATSAAGE